MESNDLPIPHLAALLQLRCKLSSDKVAYTFLVDGEVRCSLTYGELERRAQAIAAYLHNITQSGERAILVYPAGLAFITAFFGCLYANLVPVPVPVPQRQGTDQRLVGIVQDAEPTVILTEQQVFDQGQSTWVPSVSHLKWCLTDTIPETATHKTDPHLWQPRPIQPQDLALLQYTSGSTGQPKGVMVSHRNLLYNQEMLRQAFQTNRDSVWVGWLPHFHDMGLIGLLLHPLYAGIPCVFMAPFTFMRRPLRWLQAISTYRGTIAGAPNFAYELCLRKITPEQKSTLDLSSWSVAFNGSEPVNAITLKHFAAAFAECGFRPESLYPCYGLAEASLFVAGGRLDCAPTTLTVEAAALRQNHLVLASGPSAGQTQTLVSCGRSWLAQKVVIVDPQTCEPCPPGEIGEIWVQGDNVAQGYWQKPELTRQLFQARLQSADLKDPSQAQPQFLRTGDLGVLHDGELFVTGRLKDLIILYGHNHYPQDIEQTVQNCHPQLKPDCGVAFSITIKGQEQLVIVQERKRQLDDEVNSTQKIIESIRHSLVQNHELRAWEIVLVRSGTLPKTSSGKICRNECRHQFIEGLFGDYIKCIN